MPQRPLASVCITLTSASVCSGSSFGCVCVSVPKSPPLYDDTSPQIRAHPNDLTLTRLCLQRPHSQVPGVRPSTFGRGNSTQNRHHTQLGMASMGEGRERATDLTQLPYSTCLGYLLLEKSTGFHPSICPSIHPSIYDPLCIRICHPSIHPSIHPSMIH